MTDTPEPKMSPTEGQDAIFDLLKGVIDATADQDLEGLNSIVDKLGDIVAATGIDVPGFDTQQTALKVGSLNVRHHDENSQAAMWVGDLERANALLLAGPDMGLETMGVPFYSLDDDEIEGFEFDLDPEFQDIVAASEEPDLYEKIAQGAQGAIDDFVQSGADPNLPFGPSQHTALLAALDAPSRRVQHIKDLIAAGADAGVIHTQGDNALSWAMGYHHLETVTQDSETALMACLAEHGVDANHIPFGYWTVLHRAIIQGGAAQVSAVLALGADITTCMFATFEPQKLANLTPLMLAAPKPEVLRLLLKHGADSAQPDATGRMPLDFVEREALAARARAREDDPWTIAHAEALEKSVDILRDHQEK